MVQNNRICLLVDDIIYEKIYYEYGIFNEKNELVDSYLSDDNYFITRLKEPEKINKIINKSTGINHLTHVIIQKNFYNNLTIINILKRIKFINPTVKVILYFKENINDYELLLSKIAEEQLAMIVTKPKDILPLFDENNNYDYKKYIIEKPTKKQKRLFKNF